MNVFITGITGTLGTALARLHNERGDRVWGCARNEFNICKFMHENPRVATVFTGCASQVSDTSSDMSRSALNCDRVYHCAAMKHVDLCEANPVEAWRQNVRLVNLIGSMLQELEIKFILASSDKSCLPQSVYGSTKLVAERITLRHGGAVARFGNIIGSSGSVFQRWQDAVRSGKKIELTDPEMTRYFIGVRDAAEFMVDHCESGLISIPNMKSARMGMIAGCIRRLHSPVVIGPRPGETTHQWLFAPGETVKVEPHRYVIGNGGRVWPNGATSETAEQWDMNDLLKLAGLGV